MPPLCWPYHLKWTRELTPLPAAALGKEGAAPCRGSRVELMEVWVSQECERGGSGPTPHLLYGGMGRRGASPTPHCLWQVGVLTLRSSEWESCFCPSQAAPHPGNTVEQALMV